MRSKQKGQGSLEYLLLIGGAVLIAIVVVGIIRGASTSGKQSNEEATKSYHELVTNTIIPPTIINVTCTKENATYIINPSITKGVTKYCIVIDEDIHIEEGGCVTPTGENKVIFEGLTLETGKHKMSLVAKKGNAYSISTNPANECIVK